MTSNIYKITDRTNNKIYIGQTKRDIYKRFADHISKALYSDRKNDKATALYIAINNHKPENFYIESIETVEGTPKDIDNREIYWIAKYDSTNPDKGYNLDKGGHIISEACRKAAEKHLFKAGSKLEGKMLENARNNGYKVAKAICQFSKDGKFIKEYSSIIEASRQTGCDRRAIQRQINDNRFTDFTNRSISNVKYIWAYKEDVNIGYLVRYGNPHEKESWSCICSDYNTAKSKLDNYSSDKPKSIETYITYDKLTRYLYDQDVL